MSIVVGFILALIIPLLFLGIIYKSDFYQTGQFHLILKCLFWGGVTFAPATFIYKTLEYFWLKNPSTIDHFVAPIYEELLKGLILLYLFRRAKFTYSVDGALYGFAVGTGFAMIENLGYIYNAQSEATIVAIQRIFSANLVHALSSASIGITLGISRSRNSRLQRQVHAVGLLLAIGQHMLYNNILHIISASDSKIPLGAIFIPGLPGIFFILYVIQRGKKDARKWIKEKLGMDSRVTRSEVALVDSLPEPKDALYPVAERFGVEKARLAEKMLYLQAHVGIKRKALEGCRGEDISRKNIEAEIDRLHADIKNIQSEIGVYAMLFIRGLFTEEMVSVWDQMQVKVQERSAANKGQKGGGVWASLDERVNLPAEDERVE